MEASNVTPALQPARIVLGSGLVCICLPVVACDLHVWVVTYVSTSFSVWHMSLPS